MNLRPVPSFVSYAQNFEDVVLWRVFKNVDSGSYIDIGAFDPVVDSVSLAFYEKGWRGVHVEPVHEFAARLIKHRPDEEVLEVLVAAKSGNHPFYFIPETGLSTADAELAAQHSSAGFDVRPVDVPTMTLSEILDRYDGREIHWLKIDVEGLEKEVLRSWAQSKVRPWIVIVEATLPGSQIPAHQEWEPELLARGYEFSYFDGLNRFYVHAEHSDLSDFFDCGPNVFDDFCFGEETANSFVVPLTNEIEVLGSKIAELEATILALTASQRDDRGKIRKLQNELSKIYASTSWKATGWLRSLGVLRSAILQRFGKPPKLKS